MSITPVKKKYDDCFYCGGSVVEKLMPREVRWHGQLFVFENVPLGVCTQCGEKFITPQVSKMIDTILLNKKQPQKTIQVPVYSYGP